MQPRQPRLTAAPVALQVLQEVDNCYCVVLHAMLDSGTASSCPPAAASGALAYPDLGALSARLGGGKQPPTPAAEPSTSAAPASATSGSGGQADAGSGAPDTARLAERLQQARLAGSPVAAAGTPAVAGPALPGIATATDGGGDSAAAGPGSAAAAAAAAALGVASPTASDAAGSLPGSPAAWQIGTRKRTLFAGFVSYGQILEFMAGNRKGGLVSSILGGGGGPQKDKVVMTGPGGTGRAEVAVVKLERAAPPGADAGGAAGGSAGGGLYRSNSSSSTGGGAGAGPQPDGGGGNRLGGLLQRARQLAVGVQKAISDMDTPAGVARCNMQCALMQLKLPVSYLAQELLEAM
jgi:hypothetical protein